MKQAIRNRKVEALPKWEEKPFVDPEKLETGSFKFGGLFENRGQDRISQRELGYVSIFIRIPHNSKSSGDARTSENQNWLQVKLWDFTSISFGVIHEAEQGFVDWSGNDPGTSRVPSTLPYKVGDEIEVRLSLYSDQEFIIKCEIKNLIPEKEGLKIGLRRLDVNIPQTVPFERRDGARLPLMEALSLDARIKHPFLYGHWCPLRVSDVNSNMGLSFQSEDASVLLFQGMELQVHFELASLRATPMIVRVAWVHATEANQVKFGVSCLDMDLKLHNGICEFLLFSRQWTPVRLRESGFKAQQVKSRLRFRTVKTMSDYAETLHLRRDAYVGAGKKSADTTAEAMAGPLDGISRILMAHHQDKLVGSMTFTYPTSEETILDSQSGFPGQKYPTTLDLPPKANLIEVSRLCIHSDYRSTDLLQGLFEHGIKHFLMSDRHWMLTSAVKELLPTYERIGFRKLGVSYKHPGLNFKEHHLILAHRNAFLLGRGMNILVWNTLFGEVISHLVKKSLIDLTKLEAKIIQLKLLLRPLSNRLLETRAKLGFRKHLQILRKDTAQIS